VFARRHARYCSPRCRAAGNRVTIPAELRARPQWVTHKPGGRIPLQPDGRVALVNDPGTWSPYAAVRDLACRGYVLNGTGHVVIDLDHCITGGELAPWAAEILARCPATWIEISPSGTGLHVWGRGYLHQGRRIRDGRRSIEVYGTGRHMTVTGRRWRAAPATLANLGELIAELLPAD
jgi:primase-polymerase (primpol)-like protein